MSTKCTKVIKGFHLVHYTKTTKRLGTVSDTHDEPKKQKRVSSIDK